MLYVKFVLVPVTIEGFSNFVFFRLPQLIDSKNKLVQLGSGNSTPDLTKTVSSSGSSASNRSSVLPDYPERYN